MSPRKPPMAEEAPGEPESAAEPDTSAQQRELQESFESPPPRRATGETSNVRQMQESDEDLG